MSVFFDSFLIDFDKIRQISGEKTTKIRQKIYKIFTFELLTNGKLCYIIKEVQAYEA